MLGVSILFSLLTLGYALTKQDAGKTLQPLILSIVLTQIAILIWSSVVVFGKLSQDHLDSLWRSSTLAHDSTMNIFFLHILFNQ